MFVHHGWHHPWCQIGEKKLLFIIIFLTIQLCVVMWWTVKLGVHYNVYQAWLYSQLYKKKIIIEKGKENEKKEGIN